MNEQHKKSDGFLQPKCELNTVQTWRKNNVSTWSWSCAMCKGAYSAFLGRQHTRIAHTVQKEGKKKKKDNSPPTASTPPPLKIHFRLQNIWNSSGGGGLRGNELWQESVDLGTVSCFRFPSDGWDRPADKSLLVRLAQTLTCPALKTKQSRVCSSSCTKIQYGIKLAFQKKQRGAIEHIQTEPFIVFCLNMIIFKTKLTQMHSVTTLTPFFPL